MKKYVLPFVFGVTLAVLGFPLTTWQFWVLVPMAAIWANWPEKQL